LFLVAANAPAKWSYRVIKKAKRQPHGRPFPKNPQAVPVALPKSFPRSPGFYTRDDVLAITGVSYPTLWKWMRDGFFPIPREIGKPGGHRSSLRWLVSEVDAWTVTRPKRFPKGQQS
jgi:predicted DNA-binding transcriptional regulator AlpA